MLEGCSRSPGADLRQGTLLCAGCVNEAAIIKVLGRAACPPLPWCYPGVVNCNCNNQPLPVRCVYINVPYFEHRENILLPRPFVVLVNAEKYT